MTEHHTMIASLHPGLRLFLRHAPAQRKSATPPVLYVHGATFPSALSIAHRFDGLSWEDDLAASGFDVWSFDFHGFDRSDPFPEMAQPADANPPLGATPDGAAQIERAARFILKQSGTPSLSIVAHSWGTIAAGLFASRFPELVDRLVFFGPITPRDGGKAAVLPAWGEVTLDDQWRRFVADVPAGEAPVLSRSHFADWGARYLASDNGSAGRSPPAVRVPNGPRQGIADAWAGKLG
ncbi:MAG: alpha/beta fold hydrolase, partial [Acetobacteraceae bacterium]